MTRTLYSQVVFLALYITVVLLMLTQCIEAILRESYLIAVPAAMVVLTTAFVSVRQAREVHSKRGVLLGMLLGFVTFVVLNAAIYSITNAIHPETVVLVEQSGYAPW